MNVKCLFCGQGFTTYPCRLKKGHGKFCSIDCYAKWQSENKSRENNPHWQGGKTVCICEICGAEFEVDPSVVAKSGGRFCSNVCAGKWRSQHLRGSNNPRWQGKIKTTCQQCGEEFETHPCRIKVGRDKFCSKECEGHWRSEHFRGKNHHAYNRVAKVCEQCGKPFEVAPNVVKAGNGRFCSQACMLLWRSEKLSGENHPNWRGGLSFEPYTTDWTPALRRYIRKRDNHTCAVCGKRAKSVHHINYLKDDCRGENLITLCRKCHGKTNVRRCFWTVILAPVAEKREATWTS